VAFLCQDLDDVAAIEFVAQRNDLAIHFRANALMPYFGVHQIGKVDGRRTGGQFQNAALRGECVDVGRSKVHFERREKLAGLLQVPRPLDQLAHPGDALVVIF